MASAAPRVEQPKGRSLFQDAFRRFFRHTTGVVGLSIIVFLLLATFLAPVLRPYNAQRDRNLQLRLLPPTWTLNVEELAARDLSPTSYIFGADELGRDLFVRVWHGGRISLRAGLLAVAIAFVVGVSLGLVAGYFGGWLDMFLVWLVDIMLAFPGILLAIAIVAAFGPSLTNALVAVSITQIPIYIRITRGVVIGIRDSEHIQAARSLGAGSTRIILAHILPNVLSPIIVQLTLSIGTAILDIAALGFLGLGAQPPEPEWGVMIRDGYRQFLKAPWLSIFPGLAIFLAVLGFNLLGDAARDVLDPRLRE